MGAATPTTPFESATATGLIVSELCLSVIADTATSQAGGVFGQVWR